MKTIAQISTIIALVFFSANLQAQYDNIIQEPTICFKWDGLQEGTLYPASISIQKLEDDEFFIKLYRYGSVLPTQKVGLPSIETIHYSRTKEILDFFQTEEAHLIKFEDALAHLVKFEDYLAHLVHPDWDGRKS